MDMLASSSFTLDFERPLAQLAKQVEELQAQQAQSSRDYTQELAQLRAGLLSLLNKTYANLTAWEVVRVARHERRPRLEDFLEHFTRCDFCELHGDRTFGDDLAIVTGFARIGGHKVMLIGQSKGRNLDERMARNFGCPNPEGYRKALLKMRLAAKFGVPIVTLIDTPGAYPGVGAEERGQSQAIALNLMEMSRLRTPIVSVVIGEGGSGGALGVGVADRLAMFEHSYYSVISPEGCASILFKDASHAARAAEALRLTAKDLRQLGLLDDILPEPLGGNHRDVPQAALTLEAHLGATLKSLKATPLDQLLEQRYQRYRGQGQAFVHDLGAA